MTGAALTKFGLAPRTCVIALPIAFPRTCLSLPSVTAVVACARLRRLPERGYGVETTVRRGLPLIAAAICPRDCKADAARRRTRRIRDGAARGRRPGARGDARLAGAARTAAQLAAAGRPVRPGRRAVGRGRPPR